MSLALVYLSRGTDGGLTSSREFFEAYRTFPAGCLHELIVIAKGWAGVDGREELQYLAQINNAKVIDLPDDGYDWGAYMRLIPKLDHDWVCFLNTHSRPRVHGWLCFLHAAATLPNINIGAVSATASWQSLEIPLLPPASLKTGCDNVAIYPLRLIRHAIRIVANIGRIGDFALFPNPHLRTNAFIVRRDIFVEFISTQNIPHDKRDAEKIESGKAGFTSFLQRCGLKVLVAGANGEVFEPEQWICSGTFRVPGQPNLLVADNQTKAYQDAAANWKSYLTFLAWGRQVFEEGRNE